MANLDRRRAFFGLERILRVDPFGRRGPASQRRIIPGLSSAHHFSTRPEYAQAVNHETQSAEPAKMSDKPKRRWFHFSIRDLLLVTMIVAVCVAWWLDHRRQAAEIDRLKPMQSDIAYFRVLLSPTVPAPIPPKP